MCNLVRDLAIFVQSGHGVCRYVRVCERHVELFLYGCEAQSAADNACRAVLEQKPPSPKAVEEKPIIPHSIALHIFSTIRRKGELLKIKRIQCGERSEWVERIQLEIAYKRQVAVFEVNKGTWN